jgi:hypothetical protein
MVSPCSTVLGSRTTSGKKSFTACYTLREMNSVVAAICCDRNIDGSHYIYPWV